MKTYYGMICDIASEYEKLVLNPRSGEPGFSRRDDAIRATKSQLRVQRKLIKTYPDLRDTLYAYVQVEITGKYNDGLGHIDENALLEGRRVAYIMPGQNQTRYVKEK